MLKRERVELRFVVPKGPNSKSGIRRDSKLPRPHLLLHKSRETPIGSFSGGFLVRVLSPP